jgi:hypothetical protein
MLGNAALGLLFLPRAYRELFGEKEWLRGLET